MNLSGTIGQVPHMTGEPCLCNFVSGAPGEGSINSEIQINWNSFSMLLVVQEIDATQILL